MGVTMLKCLELINFEKKYGPYSQTDWNENWEKKLFKRKKL